MTVLRRLLSACRSNLLVRSCWLAAIVLATSGCNLQLIPFEDPSPRSFVLPRLLRQCMAGFSAAPAVELLDGGVEPRTELRFVPRTELEATLLLLPAWSFGPVPKRDDSSPRYDMQLTWSSTGARGQHCYEFVVHGADVEQDDELPVMGVVGIAPFGAVSVATDALDDDSYIAEGELFRRLSMVQPLLPPEAVGVGARWRHRAEGHLRGELLEIEATYTLASRRGSHVVLGLERRVRRPSQTVHGHGGSRRVEARDSHHVAVLDVDLRERPFPSVRLFDATGESERIVAAYR